MSLALLTVNSATTGPHGVHAQPLAALDLANERKSATARAQTNATAAKFPKDPILMTFSRLVTALTLHALAGETGLHGASAPIAVELTLELESDLAFAKMRTATRKTTLSKSSVLVTLACGPAGLSGPSVSAA